MILSTHLWWLMLIVLHWIANSARVWIIFLLDLSDSPSSTEFLLFWDTLIFWQLPSRWCKYPCASHISSYMISAVIEKLSWSNRNWSRFHQYTIWIYYYNVIFDLYLHNNVNFDILYVYYSEVWMTVAIRTQPQNPTMNCIDSNLNNKVISNT